MDRLSPIERRTLVVLAEKGPAGTFDHDALSKLFSLDLVGVDDDRRLVLTEAGFILYRQIIESRNSPAS